MTVRALTGLARVCLAAGVAALACGGGCASDPRSGYSFESTFPSDVQSVSVNVFDNYSTTPGVEAALTEAIVKEIQRSTRMKVVAEAAADSSLQGVINSVSLRRLSLEPTTGMVQELSVTITIDFDWKDLRSGKTLTSRRSFSAVDTFVPARPTNEPLATGIDGATQRLAQDLVSELRSAW